MSLIWVDLELGLIMLWLWTSMFNITTGYELTADKDITYTQATDITTQKSKGNDLTVHWIYSTTSSIAVSWTFYVDTGKNHTFDGSTVEYYVEHGRFTSHMFKTNINSFVLENLDVATLYTICVQVYETIPNPENNRLTSSIEHSKCVQISTIPYIRRDSVIVLVVTMGYFAFMALIGYSQWRRKLYEIQRRHGRNVPEYNEECDQTQPMRCQESSERQSASNHLNSIEEHPA